jgi:hypothetical protein
MPILVDGKQRRGRPVILSLKEAHDLASLLLGFGMLERIGGTPWLPKARG